MVREEIPGALVHFVVPGHAPFAQAFGLADKATGVPMTLDTHFRIGSLTKTFVGVLILHLVDQGAVTLDDTLDTWGFALPNANQITIRHLLSMSSGLVNYTDTDGYAEFISADPTATLTIDAVLALAAAEPLFEPGVMYAYSNTNYILLGLIAEAETGQDLASALRDRVFAPVGLLHTGFAGPIPSPYAHGYGNSDPALPPELEAQLAATPVVAQMATPPAELPVDADGHFDATAFDTGWAWAAGEAWSTVGDVAIWLAALVSGATLSPGLAASRFDWVLVNPDQPEIGGYGLGLANHAGWLGHNGAIPGYSSMMSMDPETGLAIVVLANLYPGTQAAWPPSNQIADAVLAAAD